MDAEELDSVEAADDIGTDPMLIDGAPHRRGHGARRNQPRLPRGDAENKGGNPKP